MEVIIVILKFGNFLFLVKLNLNKFIQPTAALDPGTEPALSKPPIRGANPAPQSIPAPTERIVSDHLDVIPDREVAQTTQVGVPTPSVVSGPTQSGRINPSPTGRILTLPSRDWLSAKNLGIEAFLLTLEDKEDRGDREDEKVDLIQETH